jgi:uncharacterized protein YyaL (SSP411 family)
MTSESFAHPDCAALLNEQFIPIIVDRQERPDIDTIYMTYVQALYNVGGWPLNLFLTPELEPVFGGTYWPAPVGGSGSNSEGTLNFLGILQRLQDVWQQQEARCRKEASEVPAKLREFAIEGTMVGSTVTQIPGLPPIGGPASAQSTATNSTTSANSHSELDLDQLEEAYVHVVKIFDPVYGGFGVIPKFLTPARLSFLLRLPHFPSAVQDVVGPSECGQAKDMAIHTLRQVRDSGLCDHIGNKAFSRCSVTQDWSLPEFEKLVVDNALLLGLFLDAWLISGPTKDNEFYDVITNLADYLTSSPICLPSGVFASSEAADSLTRTGDKDMGQGVYYLWTRREFDNVIGDQRVSELAAEHWNITYQGNVDADDDPNDEYMNQNIPRVVKDFETLSKQFGMSQSEVKDLIGQARNKLREHRNMKRPRPEVDEIVIAGWNGLVISILSRVGASLSTIDKDLGAIYIAAATKAALYIKDSLWDSSEKILYRTLRNGTGDTRGFAEDYAFVVDGALSLYEVTGEDKWLDWAEQLQGKATHRPTYSYIMHIGLTKLIRSRPDHIIL